MVHILIRFRSAKLRQLVALALSQGFGQRITGAGHLGIICPVCGVMTVFSGTQRDCTGYKYLNQEVRLRNHGLTVKGKSEKECANVQRGTASQRRVA